MTDDECRPLRSATPLMGVDDQQRIVCLNSAAEALLGVREAEARGRRCHEIMQGLDIFGNRYCVPNCPVHCARVRGEPTRPFELEIDADGGPVPVQIHTLRLEDDDTIYLVLAPRDGLPRAPRPPEARADPVPPRGERSSGTYQRVEQPEPARTELAEPLTPRETQVLEHVARGATTAQVAKALFIAEATVRNHVQRILQKLGAHSRLEAVAIAREAGLL